MRVTLDSNVFPLDRVRSAGEAVGAEFYVVSVTVREEEGTSFEAQVRRLSTIPEAAVWDESRWGESVWGSDSDTDQLDEILAIMGSASLGRRENLTRRQRSQLGDALIVQAHVRSGNDVLVSCNQKAFFSHGRRERLQGFLDTKIMTPDEFIAQSSGERAERRGARGEGRARWPSGAPWSAGKFRANRSAKPRDSALKSPVRRIA